MGLATFLLLGQQKIGRSSRPKVFLPHVGAKQRLYKGGKYLTALSFCSPTHYHSKTTLSPFLDPWYVRERAKLRCERINSPASYGV